MAEVIHMPEVLAGADEAAINAWLVTVGQDVEVGTILAEIETEKAVIEYNSEVAGTVLQLLVEEGASIPIGEPILVVGAPGESVDPPAPAAEANVENTKEPVMAQASASAEVNGSRRFMSPLVRKMAREQAIDLGGITGTGPGGRIVRKDLEKLLANGQDNPKPKSAPTPVPQQDPVSTSAASITSEVDVEEVPLTPMRRAIARRLSESKSTVPHFYLAADVRIDSMLKLRQDVNAVTAIKVSVNDFVLKAVAKALREVPEANSTWGDNVLRRHQSVDIAVAVAIEGGLVTPVVRDVDRLTLSEVARSVRDVAERGRDGKLKQQELEGGTFTVSNLGMYGTQEFSAIINPPHAGILAVGAGRQVPVVENGELAVGTMMTVTLSADHRVIDGAVAAKWLAAFVKNIENPLGMLA